MFGSIVRSGAIVSLIIYYVAFVLLGDLAGYFIRLIVERKFGSHASLIVFLALYALVLWVARLLAVRMARSTSYAAVELGIPACGRSRSDPRGLLRQDLLCPRR